MSQSTVFGAKNRGGKFNSDLRKSKSDNKDAYIIDVLPGTHELMVTYNAMEDNSGMMGSGGPMQMSRIGSNASVGGLYRGPGFIKWNRTSETAHILNGGEIYVVGLKMLTASGEIDLYALDKSDRVVVIETRERAEF